MAEPMLAPEAAAPQRVDRELFSLHPEEQMTERPSHRLQGTYGEQALRRLLPGWYVAGNMGVYWVPGEMEYPSAGPDIMVARGAPAREDASVYLTYEDGPLTLVVEIASPSTRSLDRHKRDTVYAIELAVPWYLWIDLPRRVLALYRLVEGQYQPVSPDAEGRLWCDDLGVGFAWQPDGRMVRVLDKNGTVVPTEAEEAALREAAEERAARQAQRAEREARRAAREAQRAEREARRAQAEADARRAAEERAEALAAELERLRRMLAEAGGSGDTESAE
jgi:Uma2 family endonuclease